MDQSPWSLTRTSDFGLANQDILLGDGSLNRKSALIHKSKSYTISKYVQVNERSRTSDKQTLSIAIKFHAMSQIRII